MASLAARRLAREHGIDLVGLQGSGQGGRITEADVLKAVEDQAQPTEPAPSATEIIASPLARRLAQEQAELSTHLASLLITDEQIADLAAFCAEVREGLDEATFEDQRRYFELLDLRGTLVVENGEKVVYVQCKLASPQRLEIRISHLSSTLSDNAICVTARLPLSPTTS